MMSRKLTFMFLAVGLALTSLCSSAMAGVLDYTYTYDPTSSAPLPSAATPSWTLTRPAGTGDALEVAGELFSWNGSNGSPSSPMSTPGGWTYDLDSPAANGVTAIDSANGFVFEERFKQGGSFGNFENSKWAQGVRVRLENTAQTQFYDVILRHTENRISVYDLKNDAVTEIVHSGTTLDKFVTAKYTFKDGDLDIEWNRDGEGVNTVPTITLASSGLGSVGLGFGAYTGASAERADTE